VQYKITVLRRFSGELGTALRHFGGELGTTLYVKKLSVATRALK